MVEPPTAEEFKRGYLEFQRRERRDAMYKIASFLVEQFWGMPSDVADGLGVLLLTWNQAFYRYGLFDFDALEECLSEHQTLLDQYRKRNILSYSISEDRQIRKLFSKLLTALQICEGASKGKKSPVSVAKTLHLLAPDFFPLWDDKISRAYDCYYATDPEEKYVSFMRKMKRLVQDLQPRVNMQDTNRTFLKLIDEYNYATITKKWIQPKVA